MDEEDSTRVSIFKLNSYDNSIASQFHSTLIWWGLKAYATYFYINNGTDYMDTNIIVFNDKDRIIYREIV